MERKAQKALAAAVAVMFVLGMSSGASALSIVSQSWHWDSAPGQVGKNDLSVSVIKLKELIEEKRQERREALTGLLTKLRDRIHHVDDRDGGGAAAPEPSAALVFGLGLLVASRFHRRKR